MKRLFRDRWDKKVGGVCGGLGHYFKIDPTWIRLLMVVLCIFTFILPVVVVYIVAWLLIPQGPSAYIEIPCKKLYRLKQNRKISGVCGGIAVFFHVDSTLVRLITVGACFITGVIPLVLSYFFAMLIIPEDLSKKPFS